MEKRRIPNVVFHDLETLLSFHFPLSGTESSFTYQQDTQLVHVMSAAANEVILKFV